jgi:hypothetical protein
MPMSPVRQVRFSGAEGSLPGDGPQGPAVGLGVNIKYRRESGYDCLCLAATAALGVLIWQLMEERSQFKIPPRFVVERMWIFHSPQIEKGCSPDNHPHQRQIPTAFEISPAAVQWLS